MFALTFQFEWYNPSRENDMVSLWFYFGVPDLWTFLWPHVCGVYQGVGTRAALAVCPQHTRHLWRVASVWAGWRYAHCRDGCDTEHKQSQHFYNQAFVYQPRECDWGKCEARSFSSFVSLRKSLWGVSGNVDQTWKCQSERTSWGFKDTAQPCSTYTGLSILTFFPSRLCVVDVTHSKICCVVFFGVNNFESVGVDFGVVSTVAANK